MRNRKPVINYTRVADGILFATHGDRKQGRGGGRKKQKRPSEPSKARRKRYRPIAPSAQWSLF
jgi:hypothetical protein